MADWTESDVKGCLVDAFRRVQGVPIYSPSRNLFERAGELDRFVEPSPLDLVGLTSTYLGRRSEIRLDLLAWARARGAGTSLAAHCRDFGRGRTCVYANRDRAARLVAAGLNRDKVPLASACSDKAA